MNQPGATVPGRLASAADDADRATLDRIVAGEDGAIEILYERYKSMAYALAVRITGDAALAEDVLQDAFVGAWRNAGRYQQGRSSVKTWLLSIVHHRAIDATRRRRPTTELPDADAPTPTSLTLPDLWPEVAGRLDRDAVVAALGTLSDVQREALELGYFGGLTQQEIAERTGTPLGTVKSRMRLGLLAMRRSLTGDETVVAADRTAPA
jgi:RNA polymerase sigma-70 factor, ECF subfamily